MSRRSTILTFALAASLSASSGCRDWDAAIGALGGGSRGSHEGHPTAGYDGGLADADGGDSAAPPDEARPEPRAAYTPLDDVAFIDFFKPHHAMAIRMAAREEERGADPEVRRMAGRMRASQTREVERMREAREELTGEGAPPPVDDPTGEADQARLASLEGRALDVAFLAHMIAHHGGGLGPSHRAAEHLRRADLREMARSIYDQQSAEIGEMYDALQRITRDARRALGVESRAIDSADVRAPRDLRAPFTPTDDLRFTDFMLPHHASAVLVADAVIARGHDTDVRRLAQQIRDAQRHEIEAMRRERQALGVEADPPPIRDPHMERDMATMRTLSGLALDRWFLAEMIPHHGGGLEPAHRALAVLRRPALVELATGVMDAQSREIREMHAMLERLSGAP